MTAELVTAVMRAVLTGVVVWAVLFSVQRASAAVTAVVLSLPMIIGPAFMTLSAVQDDTFVLLAALRAGQAMLAVAIMLILILLVFNRLNLVGLMVSAVLTWAVAALFITADATPWSIWVSVAAGLALLGLSHVVVPFRAHFNLSPSVKPAPRRLWPAAVQATVISLFLSLFAEALAPTYSAILSSVPLATLLVTFQLKQNQSTAWESTLQSVRMGMPCLYAYVAGLVLLIPLVGGAMASWLAFVPSALLAIMIVRLRLHLSSRRA